MNKLPEFKEYKKRKILVSIDEMQEHSSKSFSEGSRRDIFPFKPLKYRTMEDLYKVEGIKI